MKKLIILFSAVLIFSACDPLLNNNRTIDDTYCYTIERNYSTYNLFIQYYFNDGTISRKKILKSTENRTTSFLSDDYIDMTEMLENNYNRFDPQFSGIVNPNSQIKKIIFVDIDTNKVLKRLDYTKDYYYLGFADYDWDKRCKWEYWILDITNEWLLN